MLKRRGARAVLSLVVACGITAGLAWWAGANDGLARDGLAGLVTYGITESGSAWCVPLLLVVALALWATDPKRTASVRRRETLVMFVVMLAGLPATAALIESVVKPRVRAPRPSHERLVEVGWITDLDAFYSLDKPARRAHLRTHTQAENFAAHAARLRLHPRVLNHWIHESGSTFPSAHALNAFLAATLLWGGAFAAPTRRRRALAFTFVFWAIAVAVSRVALGVHRPVDVVVGAVAGVLLGLLFLWPWWQATQKQIARVRAAA